MPRDRPLANADNSPNSSFDSTTADDTITQADIGPNPLWDTVILAPPTTAAPSAPRRRTLSTSAGRVWVLVAVLAPLLAMMFMWLQPALNVSEPVAVVRVPGDDPAQAVDYAPAPLPPAKIVRQPEPFAADSLPDLAASTTTTTTTTNSPNSPNSLASIPRTLPVSPSSDANESPTTTPDSTPATGSPDSTTTVSAATDSTTTAAGTTTTPLAPTPIVARRNLVRLATFLDVLASLHVWADRYASAAQSYTDAMTAHACWVLMTKNPSACHDALPADAYREYIESIRLSVATFKPALVAAVREFASKAWNPRILVKALPATADQVLAVVGGFKCGLHGHLGMLNAVEGVVYGRLLRAWAKEPPIPARPSETLAAREQCLRCAFLRFAVASTKLAQSGPVLCRELAEISAHLPVQLAQRDEGGKDEEVGADGAAGLATVDLADEDAVRAWVQDQVVALGRVAGLVVEAGR